MSWAVVVFGVLAGWTLLRMLASDRESRVQALQAIVKEERLAAARQAASESAHGVQS